MTANHSMQGHTVIIAGSSLTTDLAWPTWATWIQQRYNLKNNLVNVSAKGLGNEAITVRAVQAAGSCEKPLLIVQLTSVDKWDWYVEQPGLADAMMAEKHTIVKLMPQDQFGYWSTGSHFPLWKQHYGQHYFGLQHAMFHSLLMLQWLQMICQQRNWPLYVLFDSPVLSVTESQLNTGLLDPEHCHSQQLIKNSLCQIIGQLIPLDQIYQPGIIGFACLNQMPWYSVRYKGHPGSLVHFEFARSVLAPVLDQMLEPQTDWLELEPSAKKYQMLVDA